MRNGPSRHLILVAAVFLASCTPPGPPGTITGVERVVVPIPPGLPPDQRALLEERNRLIQDRPQQFRVIGTGTCARLKVGFGDGQSTILWNADLATGPTATHTYASGTTGTLGWGGPKTARAEPVANCLGGATTTITLLPEALPIAVLQPSTTCTVIGQVRAGTVVNARPLNNPENTIRFSAFESRGIAGAPDAALGPPFTFPFPGLRAYSLIYRVGTQVGQGGTGVPFTVAADGPLELCINDDLPSDNIGGWGIALSVDESGAP